MITLTWPDLAGMAAVLAFVATLIGALMKSAFLTPKQHTEICDKVQEPIVRKLNELCGKIDALEQKREAAKKLQSAERLHIVQLLQRIADELKIDPGPFPR